MSQGMKDFYPNIVITIPSDGSTSETIVTVSGIAVGLVKSIKLSVPEVGDKLQFELVRFKQGSIDTEVFSNTKDLFNMVEKEAKKKS